MLPETIFSNTRFGICIKHDKQDSLLLIPIDRTVQVVLNDMYKCFHSTYNSISGEIRNFEASEQYAPNSKLVISLDYEYLIRFRQLFNSDLLPQTTSISEQVKFIVYYFAIFYSEDGSKCIGVKRPTQFKSLLKKQNALMHLVNDTLQAIPDDVFRLDNDFDFIIHNNKIAILHPTNFVLLAKMDDELLRTAVNNTVKLQKQMPFIKFDDVISNFVKTSKSKTAAKLISAICSRDDLNQTNKKKLIEYCSSLSVELIHQDHLIQPVEQHIIDFLRILDRREFIIDLTDSPESYVTPSRHIKT